MCTLHLNSPNYSPITATLKDVEKNGILVHQRQSQLNQRRAQYEWEFFPDTGLRRGIDDSVSPITADEKFESAKNIDFTLDAVKGVVTLGIEATFMTVDSLSKYEELADTLGMPEVPVYQAARWTRDEAFGYQMLNAVNPVVIQRCASLPKKFPVTDEMVKGSLNRGLSLEEEMKVRIHVCVLANIQSELVYISVALYILSLEHAHIVGLVLLYVTIAWWQCKN